MVYYYQYFSVLFFTLIEAFLSKENKKINHKREVIAPLNNSSLLGLSQVAFGIVKFLPVRVTLNLTSEETLFGIVSRNEWRIDFPRPEEKEGFVVFI